jgi:hypothetical protein
MYSLNPKNFKMNEMAKKMEDVIPILIIWALAFLMAYGFYLKIKLLFH